MTVILLLGKLVFDIPRGILLKSASLYAIWPEVLAMVAMATVLFSLSVLRFRKTVD